MGKIRAKALRFPCKEPLDLASQTYNAVLNMPKLTGEDRREQRRILKGFEIHPKFLKKDARAKPEDGIARIFPEDVEEVFIPITRRGEKILYDKLVEGVQLQNPGIGYEELLVELATCLKRRKDYIALRDQTAIPEDEEFEIIEDEEEEDGGEEFEMEDLDVKDENPKEEK